MLGLSRLLCQIIHMCWNHQSGIEKKIQLPRLVRRKKIMWIREISGNSREFHPSRNHTTTKIPDYTWLRSKMATRLGPTWLTPISPWDVEWGRWEEETSFLQKLFPPLDRLAWENSSTHPNSKLTKLRSQQFSHDTPHQNKEEAERRFYDISHRRHYDTIARESCCIESNDKVCTLANGKIIRWNDYDFFVLFSRLGSDREKFVFLLQSWESWELLFSGCNIPKEIRVVLEISHEKSCGNNNTRHGRRGLLMMMRRGRQQQSRATSKKIDR